MGTQSVGDDTRRLLVFRLAGAEYAVPMGIVREVVRPVPTRPVPGSPSYVLGVMSLGGRIVPVVDLRARFGIGGIAPREAVVLIVTLGEAPVGILVDEVQELLPLDATRAGPAPLADGAVVFSGSVRTEDGRRVKVLDVARVLDAGSLVA